MFVSADILSTKICALFSKASFVEKIGIKENLIKGMGVYMTEEEVDTQSAASQLLIMAGRKRGRSDFGKKTNKINRMSTQELKNKLKSVAIKVTKISRTGKRLPLTRIELEKKAQMFKNLQIRAKQKDIKIMYKSKNRGYIYKTYDRLMKDISKKTNVRFG
jgi:hypothetical protein